MDVAVDIVEAQRWAMPVRPPVRFSPAALPAGGGARPAPWEVELRLPRPQIGQDRYWVVWSRGE
eukprot:9027368-Lingulodinium_polyedra.AAC.1